MAERVRVCAVYAITHTRGLQAQLDALDPGDLGDS
jgi:hypothetical protein